MAPWEMPEVEPLFPPRARPQPKSRVPFHFSFSRGRRRGSLPMIAAALALATGVAAFAARPRLPDFDTKKPAVSRKAAPEPATRAIAPRKPSRTWARASTRESSRAAAQAWVASVPVEAEPGVADLLDAGHVFFRTGKLDRAEDAYREALSKSDGEPRFWLGVAEWKQGKRWRACRHFRIYLERFPGGARADDASDGMRACERDA